MYRKAAYDLRKVHVCDYLSIWWVVLLAIYFCHGHCQCPNRLTGAFHGTNPLVVWVYSGQHIVFRAKVAVGCTLQLKVQAFKIL